VTPSFVTVGEPNFFVDHDIATFRPERGDDRLGKFLHAAKQRLPRLLVEY